MKKHFLLSFTFILFATSSLLAQVTLEQTYSSAHTVGIVEISPGIQKYYVNDDANGLLKLYNLNHSLYKSITYPVGTSSYREIRNISETLFDSDGGLEVLIQFSYTSSYQEAYIKIINEDGSTLFSEDSCYYVYDDISNLKTGLINTPSGTKLIVQSYKHPGNTYRVFSVPGTLITSMAPKQLPENYISIPYPNPSVETTKIDFELSSGEEGEILLYNQNGLFVKSYKVDNTFGSLLLNNSDLPAGMYYYNLKTSSGASASQKMMIIK